MGHLRQESTLRRSQRPLGVVGDQPLARLTDNSPIKLNGERLLSSVQPNVSQLPLVWECDSSATGPPEQLSEYSAFPTIRLNLLRTDCGPLALHSALTYANAPIQALKRNSAESLRRTISVVSAARRSACLAPSAEAGAFHRSAG